MNIFSSTGEPRELFLVEGQLTEDEIVFLEETHGFDTTKSGAGEIATPFRAQSYFSIGDPIVLPLAELLAIRGEALPAEIRLQLHSYEFWQIQLTCSFQAAPGCRFHDARFSLVLQTVPIQLNTTAQGVQQNAIAYDLFPLKIEDECKVVDLRTGEELAANQEGEICARGPKIMKGYLNNPTATEAILEADRWLHTGDIGYFDEEGYIYIVDRLKELIKYKDMQVAPAELEALLVTHPAVSDAAVIPAPDEEAGEVPKAFVVLKPTAAASAEEIMAYVAGRVAPPQEDPPPGVHRPDPQIGYRQNPPSSVD